MNFWGLVGIATMSLTVKIMSVTISVIVLFQYELSRLPSSLCHMKLKSVYSRLIKL